MVGNLGKSGEKPPNKLLFKMVLPLLFNTVSSFSHNVSDFGEFVPMARCILVPLAYRTITVLSFSGCCGIILLVEIKEEDKRISCWRTGKPDEWGWSNPGRMIKRNPELF